MRVEVGDCGVSANEYSCAYGAKINFGDLAPYLTIYDNSYTKESLNIFYSYSSSKVPSHAGPKKNFLLFSSCLLIILYGHWTATFLVYLHKNTYHIQFII
jgi:hypothetical protein